VRRFPQFSKHYSELRSKSWETGKVLARRFGFSREKNAALPVYTIMLRHGQRLNAVYEDELKKIPRI